MILILPLVRLWNVPVELEALRVGEGALILDRLTHQNLLHGDLHLFEIWDHLFNDVQP